MRIQVFNHGESGFVAHGYRVPGLASDFSVWFNRDGFAIDAERIDARRRAYPVPASSPAWRYIEARQLAGLSNAAEICHAAKPGRV